MSTCVDVAEYFIQLSTAEEGDPISNMKVQKLAYYAQGFSLAIRDMALFQDRIEAWDHGPVVPALYHRYKGYGSGGINPDPDWSSDALTADERGLLNDVYLSYGQYTAWKLRNLTHEEDPWRDAYAAGSGTIIPCEVLKAYFRDNLINADQK